MGGDFLRQLPEEWRKRADKDRQLEEREGSQIGSESNSN
jgi:hypothetical protein